MKDNDINNVKDYLFKMNTAIKFSFSNIRKMKDGLTLTNLIKKNQFFDLIEEERVNWRYKTIDGTIVKSQYEMLFANCLTINNINFRYDLNLNDIKLNCDFCILNKKNQIIYIEIWGMNGDRYKERKNKKIDLYKLNNLILIEYNYYEINKLNYKEIYYYFIEKLKDNNIVVSGNIKKYNEECFLNSKRVYY